MTVEQSTPEQRLTWICERSSHTPTETQVRGNTLNAHFEIALDVVGHLGTFHLKFYEYTEFGHTTLFSYCFSPTI